MTKTWLEVQPAYGRIYQCASAMREDWDRGLDFKIAGGGPYMSCRDVERNTLNLRGTYLGIRLVQNRHPELEDRVTWRAE
jgi:hypothetical protein